MAMVNQKWVQLFPIPEFTDNWIIDSQDEPRVHMHPRLGFGSNK